MTAGQPPEEPTRRIPRAPPIATEREVVHTVPEQTLWAEVLDRLGSVRAGLVAVTVLALVALGVALWALLDPPGDNADSQGASRVRVERLADRVDRLESQAGQAAPKADVAAIRGSQQALARRVQALETTVQKTGASSQDVAELTTTVQALQDSIDALDQRVQALEQQQP
jgi:polyhydroxyalkanoate synthesis regulator phasin